MFLDYLGATLFGTLMAGAFLVGIAGVGFGLASVLFKLLPDLEDYLAFKLFRYSKPVGVVAEEEILGEGAVTTPPKKPTYEARQKAKAAALGYRKMKMAFGVVVTQQAWVCYKCQHLRKIWVEKLGNTVCLKCAGIDDPSIRLAGLPTSLVRGTAAPQLEVQPNIHCTLPAAEKEPQ